MKFSIVVPLFNEAQNVQPLHEKIVQEMQKMGEKYEIIFVDDCSTDNTAEECKKVSPITLLLLRKKQRADRRPRCRNKRSTRRIHHHDGWRLAKRP
jgi:glycosyltransferase involved in cell wall biosynthesis